MGKAIGIDLGTTNTVAAIDEAGRVKLLRTRTNEHTTPSVVSYRHPRAEKPGEVLVGRPAVNNAKLAAAETVFSVKRLIGRAYDDPRVDEVRGRYPYALQPAGEQDMGIRIKLGESLHSPIDVSALILRQCVDDASRQLGAEITHAVITVPAYFSEAQRAATCEAGEKAGLGVLKIIDEPTAAAIAFGMERIGEKHRVLVYDLGGGTFDVSIIQMANGHFQVLAIGGDNWLGGDDFDREVVGAITAWIREQTGYDPTEDRHYLMVAKQEAEKVKIALSAQESVDVIMPGAAWKPDGSPINVDDLVLTRQQLYLAVRPHIDRSLNLVKKLLKEQGLEPEDLTAVLLVGGSTLMPAVQEAVAQLFGEDKLRRQVDPMECVAIGAAHLAARLQLQVDDQTGLAKPKEAEELKVSEVTGRNLGIQVVTPDGKPDGFAVIIKGGTPYPLRHPEEKVFYTTGAQLRVPVYEGEESTASKNDLQGVIEANLPPDVPVGTAVNVQFNYDQNRQLSVHVRVHGRADLEFNRVLQRDRPREQFTPEDDWKERLEATIKTAGRFLEQYGEFSERGQKKKLQEDVAQARRALEADNRVEGKRLTQALQMDILGSGTASHLFLAERAMDGASLTMQATLGGAVNQIKRAYRENKPQRVQEIGRQLEISVARLLGERSGQDGAADLKGLLTTR